MNGSRFVERQGQAERWYLRLQRSDCTDADRADCLRWREASPEHEAAFREVEEVWRKSEALRGHAELDALLRAEEATGGRARRWRSCGWPLLVAAGALAFASLGVVLFHWHMAASMPVDRFQTVIGERRRIELPDGSTLILDTQSAIVARYSKTQRLIELEKGQASFAVSSDANRPFRVQAAGGSVTALGTRFLIRTAPAGSGAIVTLLEGSVRVEAPQGSAPGRSRVTLSPGERLRFDRSGHWTTERVDPEIADAWTRGTVYAQAWRLEDLLQEMNRYATTKVGLGDPSLADLRVSGTFRTGDPESLAKVLELSLPVRAEVQSQEQILLVRRAVEP